MSARRPAALPVCAAVLTAGACTTHSTPERRREAECQTVGAAPDAVFAAARRYYAQEKFDIIVLDTDARLLRAFTMGFPTSGSAFLRNDIVWVREHPGGGSAVRIKATKGLPAWVDEQRPARLAAEFEAMALGRERARSRPEEPPP